MIECKKISLAMVLLVISLVFIIDMLFDGVISGVMMIMVVIGMFRVTKYSCDSQKESFVSNI